MSSWPAPPPSSTTSSSAPPGSSPASARTPPPPSSSSPSPSPPTPEQAIRYADRIFCAGATGTGKSTLARQLFMSASSPRLVIDPQDSVLTDVPGAYTVYGPRAPYLPDREVERLVTERLTAAESEATLRYVPGSPKRRAEYEGVYWWALEHYPRWVWLDEAGFAAPATGTPTAIDVLLTQGRKRQIGHLACHTRPVDVAVDLYAQAQHVLLWDLPHAEDRRRVAGNLGLDWRELSDALASLERVPGTTATGFAWWQQRDRTLTVCPPLSLAW